MRCAQKRSRGKAATGRDGDRCSSGGWFHKEEESVRRLFVRNALRPAFRVGTQCIPHTRASRSGQHLLPASLVRNQLAASLCPGYSFAPSVRGSFASKPLNNFYLRRIRTRNKIN